MWLIGFLTLRFYGWHDSPASAETHVRDILFIENIYFLCVCLYVQTCSCMCVCMYVKAMNQLPQSLFPLFLLYIFSSLNLELTNWLEWLVSELWKPVCLHQHRLGVTDVSLAFHVGVGEPNRCSCCVLLMHRLRHLLATFSGTQWENDYPGWVWVERNPSSHLLLTP